MNSSRRRTARNYRSRLGERGLARFEVLGLAADRELMRSLARRLAEAGTGASRLRAAVIQALAGEALRRGGVLAVFRRSPLVGADLDLGRSGEKGRKIEI